jgi:hypothetical protein
MAEGKAAPPSPAFWDAFLTEPPNHPTDGLIETAAFFERFPTLDFPERAAVIAQAFARINSTIATLPFPEVRSLVIAVLGSLSPVAPIANFMATGLLESIVVLFLRTPETFEQSVVFLDRFFGRPDVDAVLDDVVFLMIVNFVNFTPPKLSFWRFLCRFLTRFGAKIELMCDFRATDTRGMLPIFTRSLIWTYRIVYQNPPDADEPCFWELWNSILPRYRHDVQAFEGSPVILMFKGIIHEIRLSLYWALQSTQSPASRDVWKCLYDIAPSALVEFLEAQMESPALAAACTATLEIASQPEKERLRHIMPTQQPTGKVEQNNSRD